MAKKTVKVFNLEGKSTRKIELPPVFATPLRPDVIKRAVLAIQSSRFQPQGRDPMAGKRTSAESRGTGFAMARIPRLKGQSGRAAFAPGTVGGRQSHPPVSEKRIVKRIPKKEKRLALLSAIAATASKEVVAARGHSVVDVLEIPLVVTNDLEGLKKTREVEETLIRLGVLSDIYRVEGSRKVRAGKGKSRGRKMKQSVGPLIVVAEDKGIMEAARNIPGVNVARVSSLNAEMLAPGTHPGRLTIWTDSALERLNELYGGGKQA
ncbi:50S ribosomal protein L4 [Candidatus Bathyarchaeota archaeon]|jgi:large subunit ribosomal protein L4e|nr:50S ribosomal protein L4 [Candidatus Bathyarchaeota archaeon]